MPHPSTSARRTRASIRQFAEALEPRVLLSGTTWEAFHGLGEYPWALYSHPQKSATPAITVGAPGGVVEMPASWESFSSVASFNAAMGIHETPASNDVVSIAGSVTNLTVDANTDLNINTDDSLPAADSQVVDDTTGNTRPPPAMPTNLTATATAGGVVVSWTDNAGDESGFSIYRSIDGTNFITVTNLPANTTTWTDTAASTNISYWYMVGAYNLGGQTNTPVVSVTPAATSPVPPPPPPPVALPAAPGNLAVSATTSSVTVSWTDNANDETGFRVYRSTNATNYTLIATVGSTTASWTDTNVAPSTTYWYKVGADNSAGETPSAAISATTQTPPPAAPDNLAASATANSVALTWSDNATNENGYYVFRSTDGTNFTLAAALGAGSTNWTDNSISAGTTYWYEIGVYNIGGETQTGPISVTTQTAAPATPSSLSATTTASSVALTWTNNASNASGLLVYRSTDATNYTVVAALSASNTSWTDTTVTESTQYWYKIGAYNSGGQTQTTAISATTKGTIPAAPANLTATATNNTIALSWTESSINQTGFRVYRSTNGSRYTVVAVLDASTTSWVDTGVKANTKYWYKIGAYDAIGEARSGAAIINTTVTPPGAPANLAATTTTNSVSLTWTDISTNETGYNIYRSTDGITYTVVANLGANSVSWTDTGDAAGTTYWYKVGEYNSGGESQSIAISATTQTPPPAAPAAPGNLADTTTTSSVSLTWSETSTSQTGFYVYRSTDGSNYTLVASLSASGMSWTDTSVASGTAYYYEVGAYNAGGEADSAAIAAVTQTPAPASPGNLAATTTTNSVALSWTESSTNASGFIVYRSTDGANYTLVAGLGASATGWTDPSAASGTTYYYKVVAYNAGGGASSAAIMAVTQTPALVAPGNLAATTTTSSVALTWTESSTNASGFHVYRSTDGANYALVAGLGASATGWTDSSVTSGTTYYYKVGAYNTGGETDSAAITAVTQTSVPAAPGNLAATTTTSSVALTWTESSTNQTGFYVYRSTDGTNFALVAGLGASATSWTDSSVASGTTYYYQVGAYNAGGKVNSAVITAVTQTPAPAVPTNLTAATTISSVALTWSENGTNVTGFHVYRSTNGVNYTVVANLSAGSAGWTDTSVASSTTYYYKVGAYNAGGEADSAAISAVTQTPAPATPGNLTATTTINSVTITWTDNATNETGYHIYRSTDGTNYSLVAGLSSSATGWTDTSVASSTTYYYKVGAYNVGGEADSAAITAVTQTPAPAAPGSLAAVTTASSVALTWTESSSNQTGFHVYRSTDGANYTLVAGLSSSTTGWTDTSVAASTTYYYKVGAYNTGGESVSSAISAVTQTPAPAAPGNLSATTTTSSATLTWTDNATNASGVRVYRSMDGITFVAVASLSATSTTYADSGLSAGTTYWYKVSAYNAGGETFSGAISTATQTSAPPPTGVSLQMQNMTSFAELVINGSSGNDSIYVSQSNGVLTIIADGQTMTQSAIFGDIKIYGDGGNDTITVDSSVNIATLIYSGGGNDTIKALGSAKMTIVTLGGGTSNVTGNGINTSYWVNPNDIVNASAAEIALGGVNRVSGFYQPFTTDTSSPNYIPATLLGQKLPDPTDSGTEIRLQNSSFWGTGPSMNDVDQGGIADCYYLAGLSAMANNIPQQLMNMGVDLGDGTYAVRYVRNGVTTFVRVDGDLTAGGGAFGLADNNPGADGNEWASIFEKAYAFFRSGANTYASLNNGSSSAALRDAGLNSAAVSTGGMSQTTLQNLINNELAQTKPIIANTNGSIVNGDPLVASHSYVVLSSYINASGQLMIVMRNPWGVDGFNDDSNPSDGIVTISYTQFINNFGSLSYMT